MGAHPDESFTPEFSSSQGQKKKGSLNFLSHVQLLMMSHLILSKLILYNHCCGEEVEDNKRVEDEREREEQTKLRTSMGKYKSKLKR